MNEFQVEKKRMKKERNSHSSRLDNLGKKFSDSSDSVKRSLHIHISKNESLLKSRSSDVSVNTSVANLPTKSPGPLFQAAEDGAALTILNLLKEGVDISQRNQDGDSALHVAARKGHELAVLALIGNCPVDLLGHLGSTPLHYASAQGHMSIVKRLICAGAKVNAKDTEGNFALLYAAKAGHLNIVQLLANIGVSLDTVDKEGNTSLVVAVKAEKWDVVKFLLERGASAEKYYRFSSCAPLLLVIKHKQYSLIPLMLKKMKQIHVEMKNAFFHCDDESIPYMFEGAVPGFSKSVGGCDAIVSLVRDGKVKMISAMLNIGADVNGFNSEGHSCLGYAAWDGQVETLKLLLHRGASVNLVDGNGVTALHDAALRGHAECVRLLIKAGASVNLRDGHGDTALHDAARTGHAECVRLLLEAGASVHIKNKEKETAMDVAISNKIRQILTSFS